MLPELGLPTGYARRHLPQSCIADGKQTFRIDFYPGSSVTHLAAEFQAFFSKKGGPLSDSRRRLERTAIYRLAVLAIPESDPGGGIDTVADRPDGTVAKDGVEAAGVGAAELPFVFSTDSIL